MSKTQASLFYIWILAVDIDTLSCHTLIRPFNSAEFFAINILTFLWKINMQSCESKLINNRYFLEIFTGQYLKSILKICSILNTDGEHLSSERFFSLLILSAKFSNNTVLCVLKCFLSVLLLLQHLDEMSVPNIQD